MLRHTALSLSVVLLAHLALGWAMLSHQAQQIISAGQSDSVVNVQFATLPTPSEIPAPQPEPQAREATKNPRPVKQTESLAAKAARAAPQVETGAGSTPPDLVIRQSESPDVNQRFNLSEGDPGSEASGGGESTFVGSAPSQGAGNGEAQEKPNTQGADQSGQAKPTESTPTATSTNQPEVGSPPNVPAAPLATLYSQPLAPFPKPVRLHFAVHSPKDYDESSSAGSAELRTEATVGNTGAVGFDLALEVKLGWLLSKMIGGTLRYQSQGQIGPNGPQTLRYKEKIGDRAERWLEVDREKRVMKSFQIASLGLEPGTQDRLSVMWLLSMLARTDPAVLEKGKTFSVPMFSFRQIYPARFESYGAEVLVAPAGVLQTLHVGYKSSDAGGDKVDVWLGYDYEMQPVRIRWQEAQGRVIDMILQKKPN